LETLFETGSFTDMVKYENLLKKLNSLGKMLNNFINSVEDFHISTK